MAEIINLYDFSIRENTTYEVREKLDADAPDGYREYETTKVLVNTVKNSEPGAIWDNNLGVWDTGLFESSTFLKSAIPEATARKAALVKLKKYILDPIEDLKGEDVFDNTSKNDKYWNSYSFDVYRGKTFTTSNPEDLFKLYILVLTKRLTPKELSSHPEFKGSQYLIIDKEESKTKETEKVIRKMRATELFSSYKNSDKSMLYNILDYAGLKGVNERTDESTLMLAFDNFINNKNQGVLNMESFIEAAEMTTKKGQEILYIYGKLKEYYMENIIKKNSHGIYIGDTYIANSFKVAAELIQADKELKKLFQSLEVEQ